MVVIGSGSHVRNENENERVSRVCKEWKWTSWDWYSVQRSNFKLSIQIISVNIDNTRIIFFILFVLFTKKNHWLARINWLEP
jgi:hypothetical protein